MRLIDADALIDGYKHMGYDPSEHQEESYMEGWCKGFNCAVDHCLHHVIYAPTIEPMRKKGKWIYGEDEYGIDGYHCDKCGFFVPWDYAHMFINYIEDYNFCPSCGRDMREGGENA